MSSDSYDPTLFEGAARYYAQYRPKYPQAMFDFLVERFKLDHTSRVLDLGCGTGDASLPLASIVGEIVAMDPDAAMIEVGRGIAGAASINNVQFLNAGSNDLSPNLGTFRLVCMGQSFHWMDRDRVLRDLHPLVEDEGGLALLGPAHGLVLIGAGPPGPRQSWQDAADTIMKKYVGERTRHPRANPSEPRHEQALMRSHFAIAEYHEVESELSLTPDDILGLLYSMSGNIRKRLGERIDAFERDMNAALAAIRPEGRFIERPRTGVLVAVKK